MRIVCLSDAVADRNGVGTYYPDLMIHLKEHLEHAELICPGLNGNAGVFNFTMPLPGDSTQRLYFPKIHTLWGKINQIAPDILILPTPGPCGLLGYGISRRSGAHLCVGYHTHIESLSALYWQSALRDISRMYMKYVNRLLFSASDVVITNSDEMTLRAKADGARSVRMIGTPISKPFLDDPVCPMSPDFRSVCYCGRLTAEKNIPGILEAAKHLPAVQFTIAGDGPFRENVAQAARDLNNVRFIGWVSRNEVATLIDAADMLILPSQIESFGTIALEAMARHRLVLVSEHCGILNWPELKRGVYVIEREEPLVSAIRRISSLDASRRFETGALAHTAAHRFNAQTIRQWIDLFALLVGKSAQC